MQKIVTIMVIGVALFALPACTPKHTCKCEGPSYSSKTLIEEMKVEAEEICLEIGRQAPPGAECELD